MMGNFDEVAVTPAMRRGLTGLFAWKFAEHGIDPDATVSIVSTCNGASCRYAEGSKVRLPVLFGHRDVGFTSCPGTIGYTILDRLRTAIVDAPPVERIAYVPPFSDDDSVHVDGITTLYTRGITKGCTPTTFCPDAMVRREQMASLLSRTIVHLQLPHPKSARDWFRDDNRSVHEEAINALTTAGITVGCSDDDFCPNEPVRRGDVAQWLAEAFALSPQGTDYFTDDDGTSDEWAINALADAGLTAGCTEDRYCADDATSRAQMASFLARAIDTIEADGIGTR